MIIIYLIIIFICGITTKVIFGTIYKVNMLFSFVWCTFSGLSTIGLYGLYKPDTIIHIYVLSSIFIFNTFYFTISKLTKKSTVNNIDKHNMVEPNYKLIYIINLLALTYCSLFIKKALFIIDTYGFSTLRTFAFKESAMYASTVELTIFQMIIQPIFIATTILLAIDIALKRSRLLLVIIAIIDVLMYTFLFAGRMTLVQFISIIFISLLLMDKTSLFQFIMNNKKYLLMIVGILILITFLTSHRTNSSSNVIEQVYLYLSAPFIFLSKLNEMSPWQNNLLYGKATFGFILDPLEMLYSVLFNTEYASASYIITSLTSKIQIIGDNLTFNALTTMLFPFMMDYGKLGIIIGPAFFASILALVEFKLKSNLDLATCK